MRLTVEELLRRSDLHLRPVVKAGPAELSVLVTWVIPSDLADPTPFLDRGTVVLTTGRQFDRGTADNTAGRQRQTDDAFAYIARLRHRGVCAVGFGIRVLHAGIPPALVEACRELTMPLFEVPYHVSFLAVIRATADLIDAAGRGRAEWALTATRAISAAVLRASPIDSVLAELGRQLGRGVMLMDSRGRVRAVHGMLSTDPIVTAAQAEATRLLRGGRRTGATVTVPFAPPPQVGRDPVKKMDAEAAAHTVLTMQTVGTDAAARSVLVLAGAVAAEPTEQTVVASAVALLWFALGEHTGHAAVRATLQQTLWHLLMRGELDIVRAGASSIRMQLALEPVRAVAWSPGASAVTMRALQYACDDGLVATFAHVEGAVLACVGADSGVDFGDVDPTRGVGVSEPVLYAELPGAVARVRRAARRARPGEVLSFDDPAVGGLSALPATPDMIDRARALLRPLVDRDDEAACGLVEALTVWLRENCNYGAAARRLGLHRHTLTARIAHISTLVGRDLDDIDVRMELWLALRLTGRS